MDDTNEKFKKMSVKSLRNYIKEHRLFKNVGNLKKHELISGILEAEKKAQEKADAEAKKLAEAEKAKLEATK